MNDNIQKIQENIKSLREQIVNHPVYTLISDIEDLRVFMEHHVYAVWDFMSLLKTLQNSLTCTQVPWFPKGSADVRMLINEIVLGEESDVDMDDRRTSHFELYLNAMQQSGVDTRFMTQFILDIKNNAGFAAAFANAKTPDAAKAFVDFTFSIINSGKDHLQAAIFTFGREDLIPGMFMSLVNDLNQRFPDNISTFKYYLDRHIEVDGEHHSHLALDMTSRLCGNDQQKWAEAEAATIQALQQRIALWDGVYNQIKARKGIAAMA